MAKIPYMPFYVNDFEGDTAHLTIEEDGAYNRLLRLCWRTSGCSVPDDEEWVRRKMRVTRDQYSQIVLPIIDEYFKRKNGRIFQERLQKEFSKISGKILERKKAGKMGGLSKSLKNNKKDPSKATVLLQAKGKQTSSNQNQNQNHKERENYIKEFEEFFAIFPNKQDKFAASKNFDQEKKHTSAKLLTDCAKIYAAYIEENNKQNYAFKAKNWLKEKIYLNYQPQDENLNMWNTKLQQFKKGRWLKSWGKRPMDSGWDKSGHGDCPENVMKQFMYVARQNSDGNI